ncbi:hypothetical protein P13BB106kb_p044 [Pectobacterium phage DU_PP_V]|uniref:Uncharacterized protein n=1 Tax=Pectobacterium phage DU_PP_V TaxID=2041492 RepID=A0A2D2W6V8_9CAUD|nr:hypothetical protein HOS40_gp125 [Pectobacterium phage DU_PP_V]ATS94028.1 hypothetical protein P13BB106kb_p044 [Pectobacterium phage DU_PP_V]
MNLLMSYSVGEDEKYSKQGHVFLGAAYDKDKKETHIWLIKDPTSRHCLFNEKFSEVPKEDRVPKKKPYDYGKDPWYCTGQPYPIQDEWGVVR